MRARTRTLTLPLLSLLLLLALTACGTQTDLALPTVEHDTGFVFHVDPARETVTLVETPPLERSLAPDSLPSDTRILMPGRDIAFRNLTYRFRSGNRFVMNLKVKNVSDDLTFEQPFFFTLNAGSEHILRATAPLVTDRDLGGNSGLGPGERTRRLTFEVIHKGRPFTFLIDTSAVVSEPLTVWPNALSKANSDPWLVKHHDQIGTMRPRLLVLNFSNDTSLAEVASQTEQLIDALAESSRWHGYDDPEAPVFLDYQIEKIVDLRDDGPYSSCDGNSSKYPRKAEQGINFAYSDLYTDTFAGYYGYDDPDDPGRYLTLAELVDRGIIHELWFFFNHGDCGAPFETIELKQYYDENLDKRTGGLGSGYGPAGNGHDYAMPWIGRSLRITALNAHRGIGCGMENFGHALEGMRNYDAIPCYSRYFTEYAELDLDERYGLPFDTFYRYRWADVHRLQDGDDHNRFPTPSTLEAHYRGETYTVHDFVARGGNVHLPPNARQHYDLWSPYEVMSTIESWRMANGLGGEDLTGPFTTGAFGKNNELAPDCMGPWMVYWRQNMPGLGNLARDDAGQPMMNWWPFLFY